MKSTDGGNTWSKVLAPRVKNQAGVFFYDWAADLEVAANGDLYATFGINFTEGKIFRSTDQGESWQDITPASGANRIELAIAPSTGNSTNATTVYAVAAGGLGNNDIRWMFKTDNGGANWQSISIPLMVDGSGNHFTRGHAYYDLILAVDPQNPNIVFTGGIDIHKSIDGGQSWEGLSHWQGRFEKDYVHADQHMIIFRPGNNQEMLFANDGGVYYSNNANATFNPEFHAHNANYNVTQFYSIATDNIANSNILIGGTQDNGVQLFDSEGFELTEEVLEGDGAYTFVDQDNPSRVIASRFYNTYYRSYDGGKTFDQVINFQTKGRPINPSDYDDSADILYAAGNGNELMRYSNFFGQIETSALVTGVFDGALISAIKVSPHNPNTIFVGTDQGKIFKVDNASSEPVFTDISNDLQAFGYIISIDVGVSDDELILAFSNYGVQSIWYSQNGGANWVSKDKISFLLPDMPVRWVIFNPDNYEEVMLATEMGVWRTENIKNNNIVWESINVGLANVRCDMIAYRPADKKVIVATHGRGVFTTDSWSDIPPVPDIVVSKMILINTDTQEEIAEITDGDDIEIDFAGITNLGIRVLTIPETIGSLDISLSGAFAHRQTENMLPYSLFGDQPGSGDLSGRPLPPGSYRLNVVPFSDANLGGSNSPNALINFNIIQKQTIAVTGFKLFDADTDTEIMPLEDGAVIDLATLDKWNLSIIAETNLADLGSVALSLSGAYEASRIENHLPYSLFGEDGTDTRGVELCAGVYQVTATPFSESYGQGIQGNTIAAQFTLVGNPMIESLTLIDAVTDEDLQTLVSKDKNSFSVEGLGSEITIRANTHCTQSVQFVLQDMDGNVFYENIESVKPYALFGDMPTGNYSSGDLPEGNYALIVTPYSSREGQGLPGASMFVNFTVKENLITWATANGISSTQEYTPNIRLESLFPNPVKEEIMHLKFSDEINQDVLIEISDYYGNITLQKTCEISVPTDEIEVDLRGKGLNSGIYLIKIVLKKPGRSKNGTNCAAIY